MKQWFEIHSCSNSSVTLSEAADSGEPTLTCLSHWIMTSHYFQRWVQHPSMSVHPESSWTVNCDFGNLWNHEPENVLFSDCSTIKTQCAGLINSCKSKHHTLPFQNNPSIIIKEQVFLHSEWMLNFFHNLMSPYQEICHLSHQSLFRIVMLCTLVYFLYVILYHSFNFNSKTVYNNLN